MSDNLPAERSPEVEVASSVIRSVDDLGRVAKMAAASGYFKDKNTPQKAGAAMALADRTTRPAPAVEQSTEPADARPHD
jgi:hypothetical protein